ncbi:MULTISPECIES: pyridoxal phosphate-dependent aminotransferase [unclassified Vibrio]|uniref:Aminotransferase n=1 Tax=Vibrio sp. HB236076 TaxID=3232307 RepID=A0AB39HKS6_9VIBR|nr:pyridoxal phosphate-dependent aminotransferase [Vibrio sp. HB161653]MDP5252563.1 pyridoxal phosphate-dependent aminotransferase [Vibrio sp. HB161653]
MKKFELRNQYFDALCHTEGLMWLGQNTNHYEPDESVKQAIIDTLDSGEYHAYAPPAGYEELRQLIREDMGIPQASVLVTDGAVEALFNVCSNLCKPGTDFVTTNPSWAWPMRFAEKMGANVVEIPIYGEENQFKLTPEQLREAVSENTEVIYLVDPNNPLGTCHTKEEIQAFADIARSVDAYIIHDTTYFAFAESFTPMYLFYPEKTLQIYSFSKWLGLAGMRLGAVLANEDIIERLATAPPNNLGSNVMSQRAAIAGLKTKSQWFPKVWERQRRNQAVVAHAVSQIPGLHVPIYPSQANLLIIETVEAGIDPKALVAAYQTKGIMIRQGIYHTQKFGDRFVKVSLTVPEEWADQFCQWLPEMVELAKTIEIPHDLF